MLPDTQTCYNKQEMQLIASSLVSYVRLRETHVKDSTIIFSMRANISDLKANEESLKGAIRIAEFITAEQKAISDKEIKRLNRNTNTSAAKAVGKVA